MTRTYSDPEALTRLLEEKERDLELAAHIGQGLLAEKGQLCERVEALEGDLAQAQDALTHLRHQLATKAALLQAYAQHEDCWADEEGGGRDGAGAGHPQRSVHGVRTTFFSSRFYKKRSRALRALRNRGA